MNYGVNKMEYIKIGKIVNTHGIKGEIRILSDFKYKKLVFKKDFPIYIGPDKNPEIVESYRVHKMFDMITLNGIHNINDVLKYKGLFVYIDKSSLDVIYEEDYIGLEAYTDHYVGVVSEIIKGKAQDLIVVTNQKKKYMIPNIEEFVKKIDLKNKKIYIQSIKGLIDED